jgi:hypothetical protein
VVPRPRRPVLAIKPREVVGAGFDDQADAIAAVIERELLAGDRCGASYASPETAWDPQRESQHSVRPLEVVAGGSVRIRNAENLLRIERE